MVQGPSVDALIGTESGSTRTEQLAHLSRVLADAGVLAVVPAAEVTDGARAILTDGGVDVVTVTVHPSDHPEAADVDASARAVLETITAS